MSASIVLRSLYIKSALILVQFSMFYALNFIAAMFSETESPSAGAVTL